MVGAVPFFTACAFFVFAIRDAQTANDDLGSGLLVLGAIALGVVGMIIIVFNVLATRSRPTAAFMGGLGSVGASVLLVSAVQEFDSGWATLATLIWAAANTGSVLYALGGGPIRHRNGT